MHGIGANPPIPSTAHGGATVTDGASVTEAGPMTTTGGTYLSAGEVAARLGLPVRTVLELAGRRVLPAERRPVGALRFRWADVARAWLRSDGPSGSRGAVDALAEDVGVTRVTGDLLDEVQ
jgi:hypothetical protein